MIEALGFDLNVAALNEGFTQSEMSTMSNCHEQWYLRYNLLLQKKGQWNWSTVVGSWIHSSLEEFIATKGKRKIWNPVVSPSEKKDVIINSQWMQDLEYWQKVGGVLMEIYFSHYKHDFEVYKTLPMGVEHVVDYEFEGIHLKGKIDWPAYSNANEKNLVIDHKTTGRLDKSVMMGWSFRFQFMFYLWLMWKTEKKLKWGGFLVNAIKKPQLKWNPDKESIDAFAERLRVDILTKPDNYYHREPGLLGKGDMEHFETQILKPKLLKLKIIRDAKIPDDIKIAILRDKNTDYCTKYGASYACQYIEICKQGMKVSAPLYKSRDVKHTELENESE